MNTLVVTHGKLNGMECVSEVGLGNVLELLEIALLHQFLYLMHRLKSIIGQVIVASAQGNVAFAERHSFL